MSRPRRRRTKEEREEGKFVDHMMYLLTAPMLTWPGQESIYEFNDNSVTAKLHRLGHSKEILEHQECTEFEAMLYISTVTLEHPISHDWYEVYMYLFQRWSPEKGKAADIKGPDELNNYPQKEHLALLRRWIYRQQMNRLKRNLDIDQAAVEEEAEELLEQQGELFLPGTNGN